HRKGRGLCKLPPSCAPALAKGLRYLSFLAPGVCRDEGFFTTLSACRALPRVRDLRQRLSLSCNRQAEIMKLLASDDVLVPGAVICFVDKISRMNLGFNRLGEVRHQEAPRKSGEKGLETDPGNSYQVECPDAPGWQVAAIGCFLPISLS